LAAIVLVSGVFSAFFVNDTMCLVLTPLVLDIAARLRRNPVPYLLAVAMAANIGSAATITGNPQNMMIGAFSRIPYRDFAAAGAMIGLFFAGVSVPKVAVVTGAVLLITRRVKPEKVYREIDWSLLVLFAGLFVVIAGVEKTVLTGEFLEPVKRLRLDRTGVLTVWSALLSNLASNVPAVLVFKPFISTLPQPEHAWLTLAMSSTLAGNLTVLGSIANLIVIERARRSVRITFLEYLKVGVPLTLLTLGIGVLVLG
jgi:Na+/H+ antiporter NhaD/arsenite permease-like protein